MTIYLALERVVRHRIFIPLIILILFAILVWPSFSSSDQPLGLGTSVGRVAPEAPEAPEASLGAQALSGLPDLTGEPSRVKPKFFALKAIYQ